MRNNIHKALQGKNYILFVVFYAIVSVALFLYSYTQIDLNLTLVNHPLFHTIREPFIQLGYFNRFASTSIFVGLIAILYLLYLLFLRQVTVAKYSIYAVMALAVIVSIILLFSYPAFSHDLFNYMFDARIVTEYGQNPYTHKALDFPQDSWIRFMHWTHRTYPYGPIWLLVTIPFSFLGFGKFLITMIWFKVLVVAAYLGTVYFVYRVLDHLTPKNAVWGTAFFALNPLVIIEILVSAHNDIVMIFFAVLSVYSFLKARKFLSFALYLLSVGVKFTTIFLLPMYVIGFQPIIFAGLAVTVFLAMIYRIGIQPWYFLWVMPFVSFVHAYTLTRIAVFIFTFALLLRYIPFLNEGNWYPSAVPFQHTVTIISLILIGICYGVYSVYSKNR